MMLAVKGMLPDNTLGRKALTRVSHLQGRSSTTTRLRTPTAWTL